MTDDNAGAVALYCDTILIFKSGFEGLGSIPPTLNVIGVAANLTEDGGATQLTGITIGAFDADGSVTHVAATSSDQLLIANSAIEINFADLNDIRLIVTPVVTSSTVSLQGLVNPNGSNITSIAFSYGIGFGGITDNTMAASPATLSFDDDETQVTANITGLSCAVTYRYFLEATNMIGISDGGVIGSFNTAACR